MAQNARHLYCLDRFTGDKDTGRRDTLGVFLANLKHFGVRDKVSVLMGEVERFTPLLGGSVDMVFVDASHDEHSVKRDSHLAFRLTEKGGVIVWHDWFMGSVQTGAKWALSDVVSGWPARAEKNLLIWER